VEIAMEFSTSILSKIYLERVQQHTGNGLVVNDENWGELDTLEEIFP
jgi:hypothetical protein